MRRTLLPALAGMALATLVVFLALVPAQAEDLASRITINVAPVYLFGSNGDLNAPPPPGTTGIGYNPGNHPIPSTFNVDYGIDFKIDPKTHLALAHGNVDYGLGRILTVAPNTSFVSGSLYDYTDSITLIRSVGAATSLHASYFNHQRRDVTGLCLNQESCVDAAGGVKSNPLSIDEMGYTFGFSVDFGPKTIIGPLFTATGDLKYWPRPATPNLPPPAVALGGLPGYRGTQVWYPYSMTMKVPFFKTATFIPFINYTHLPVLYRDSAVPEDYRGYVWGFSKIINKYVTFSYTNLNLQTCRCVQRVPAPDNLRLAFGVVKLDFHTGL